MKKIFKYAFSALLTGTLVFTSCETVELELLENPNSLSADQADPELLSNAVQLNYVANMNSFSGNSAALTRISNFGGRDYFAGLTGNTLNGTWSRLYAGMIPDMANIIALNQAGPQAGTLNYAEAVSKALVAHNLLLLVDFVGAVPFSEVNNPDISFPVIDNPEGGGASTYDAAVTLLDQAGVLMATETVGTDLFYSSPGAWIRFINTVKLKAALTRGDLAEFDTLIQQGSFIASTDDDMQFQYDVGEVNPDERHPAYAADYTPSGANIYQSNWLMNTMFESNDPRLRYYFFRQTDCTPGASCQPEGDGETISCSLETPPAHYADFTYCFLENGYWGRDHGDDDGTPPDSFTRTASAAYPSAGFLDLNNFADLRSNLNNNDTADDPSDDFFELVLDTTNDGTTLGAGGGGDGIAPILLASYVDFWRAERAMIAGNTGVALNFIQDGITKSVNKVFTFADADTGNNGAILSADIDASTGEVTNAVLAGSLLPTPDDVATFQGAIDTAFNNGTLDDQWNILAEQYWIAQYGGASEAYNFYRRQGFPNTLQPNLEPNPGAFPRSFPYATSEVVANPNVSQKPDQNTQVFWDNNPASSATGGFPASN